jgi:nucleoside-diphosphate-sugar epimerase
MNANDVVKNDTNAIIDQCFDSFKQFAGNNFLITGGGGFLGYYLVQSIAGWNERSHNDEKIELTVIDNFIRGIPAWLEHLHQKQAVALIKHNIIDPLPEGLGHFHFIIHAASIASPTYYRLRPIETMDANVQGLRNLLEYSKKWNETADPLKGFLFFSSSEIYGNPSPNNIPTPESYYGYVSCTGPRACYDESKRYGETLCVNFARQFDMPIKIARPFNNYGPGLKISDKRVIPDFARDILADRDVVMMSDGSPTRTFCYVADAVAGYFKILSQGKAGESYNIGTGSPEISMAELADRMVTSGRELFGYSGKLVRKASTDKEYLVDNPNRRCPDITKAKTEVGYQPSISLTEGLRRTMIWYNENREGSEA